MLRVETTIGPSAIHGTGLFAVKFIPEGTLTWAYDPGIDPDFSEDEIYELPSPMRDFLLHYCYLDHELKKFVLPADNLRYINHTDNPDNENIRSTVRQDFAARNIQPGEEMMCNYRKFDKDYFDRVGIKDEDIK